MNLRLSTVRRNGKVYQYAQLVESYRSEHDGKPTCRVVKSLGVLNAVSIANWRVALSALREGKPLLVASEAAGATLLEAEVLRNFRYLDLAVLLRIWEDLGLSRLVRACLPACDPVTVDIERVIAALVLHRCAAPGSKLAAERWFPSTALPELLGVAPAQFNNSRLHRALSALEEGDAELQEALPSLIEAREGAFATAFIDATDTWFEGHGPPLAAKGIDKEGVYRRRVGIVLLCDQRGYPLRWHTLSGRYHDATALLDMAREASTLPWLKGKPVVLDRAVGSTASIEKLAASGLRFLTGLPYTEFAGCGAKVPWDDVAALQEAFADGEPEDESKPACIGGFHRVRPDRYVLDLGVFDKTRPKDTRPSAAVTAMAFARDSFGKDSFEVAKAHDCTERTVRKLRELCRLLPELQDRVLSGEADGLTIGKLLAIAERPADEQHPAFDKAIHSDPATHPVRAKGNAPAQTTTPLRVRGVLSFKPAAYLEKRRAAVAVLTEIKERADRINVRLAAPTSKRKDGSVLAEIGSMVRRAKLGDVVAPRIEKIGDGRILLLELDEAAWQRRRQCDGLTLLVGHAELPGAAADIVDLYFSKDAVEKDFQIIKGLVELRPIRHRTDPKLRAHVTLCMLALLLERTLRSRLKAAGSEYSPAMAIETLATTHLNQIQQGKRTFYGVTQPGPESRKILAALGMDDAATSETVRSAITPR